VGRKPSQHTANMLLCCRHGLFYCAPQVQTPPANVMLAPEEKEAMQAIYKSCCPVTTGPEAPDVCSTL
jgi:hypothetical protein